MPPPCSVEALKARLGVSLSDGPLLEQALTHGSINETGGRIESNRKLAFLGDAVIGLAIRDRIYRDGPDASLDKLSRDKDQEVRNKRLAELARAVALRDCIIAGKGAEKEKDQDSVLATALEAVIGAIFFEKGFGPAAECVLRIAKRRPPTPD